MKRRLPLLILLLTPLLPAQPLPTPDQDPLGRSTPRGALLGFLNAIHREDYHLAADYLNSPLDDFAADELAQQFGQFLDTRLPANVDALPDTPDGSLTDNLPPNRDLAGTITIPSGPVPIYLDRIRLNGRLVWLFSRTTLDKVQNMLDKENQMPFEHYIPTPLRRPAAFAIPWWKWIALLAALALGAPLSGTLRRLAALAIRPLLKRLTGEQDETLLLRLSMPIRLLVVVSFVQFAAGLLSLPLVPRWFIDKTTNRLHIVLLCWFFVRLVHVSAELFRRHMEDMGRSDTKAVVRLSQRTLNGLAVFAAIAFLLRGAGYNITGLIASLGVGGIAVALAAQKTIENLLGGVSLILDKSVRVGDFCKIGDRTGTVEDIGLRSTRFRTLDRSLLIVPNGQLAVMNLENFGMRDRILLRHTLQIRNDTQPDQLRFLIVQIRKLLYAHPMIDSTAPRTRLLAVTANSYDIEIFCYVKTTEWSVFLGVQEDVLLHILDLIADAGTSTAIPSQTVYFSRDHAPHHGFDPARAQSAVEEIRKLRDSGQLPFPSFPPTQIQALDGTLPFPPEGSALRPTSTA